MMSVWGKIFGALCGYLIAGPIGMFLGLFLGHMFDSGFNLQSTLLHPHKKQQSAHVQRMQRIFFRITFSVMGHISKADGRVSENEINVARHVMNRMRLNPAMRREAIHLFTEGKHVDFDLYSALTELRQACHDQPMLLRYFIEVQIASAEADGQLSEKVRYILETICQQLGFALSDFTLFQQQDTYQEDTRYNQQEKQYQHRKQYTRPTKTSLLQQAYQTLGITASATDHEVKLAYRKLMSQHHPDKLVSKGLPEEMIQLATEKTQQIRKAYEQIKSARSA